MRTLVHSNSAKTALPLEPVSLAASRTGRTGDWFSSSTGPGNFFQSLAKLKLFVVDKTNVTNRFAAEEEKSGDVFERPRPGDVKEAVEDRNEHLALPRLPLGVDAAADGLRQAEEHFLALEVERRNF